MQVCASHATRRTDGAQVVARIDDLSLINADFTQMTVHRDVALTVIDDDGVAIEIVIACRSDDAGSWRKDWRSRACGDVHTLVR